MAVINVATTGLIEVTVVPPGDALVWRDFDPADSRTQAALEQIEPVVAMAAVGTTDRHLLHIIYLYRTKYWLSESTLKATETWYDTIADAKAVVEARYAPDYTEDWKAYMRLYPPPWPSP